MAYTSHKNGEFGIMAVGLARWILSSWIMIIYDKKKLIELVGGITSYNHHFKIQSV
jgi:hypothetical protein